MPSIKRNYSNTGGVQKQPSGRVNKYTGMYIGIVKDNVDANFMGRLRVWIPEFGSDPNDETSWRVVNYCSPFGGATPVEENGNNLSSYEETQVAYGMWMVPPDLENEVALMFANGDPARGYWFGCIPQQFMNHMIPGVASSSNYLHNDPSFPKSANGNKNLPVGEYNKNTRAAINNNMSRPVATPQYEGIAAQGLINDPIRGTTTSSARREAPSQVYGISTPGPKIKPNDPNNKHRTGGNTFVMDDGLGSEHITFKTKSGAQIKIDETNGLMYFINKTGTGWMQIDNEGNIDIFAANDISMRAQRDFNIRADRNINIESGNNIYAKAAKDYKGPPGEGIRPESLGGDIVIEAMNDMHTTVTKNSYLTVRKGNLDIKVSAGKQTVDIAATTSVKSSNYNLDAGGNTLQTGTLHANGAISSGGDVVSVKQSLNALFNHSHGGIYPGPGSTAPFGAGGAATSATGPSAIPAINKPPVGKTNILKDFSDNYKFTRNSEQISTTVDRFPTFEPCPEHKKK